MSKAEDLLWISQVVIADDRRAFDRLVCKYQSSVRRFLLNLTAGDSMLSDDLAQETFIKAYLNIRSFQGISAFSTWLFRIAYNVFYDSKRAQKHYEEINSSEIDKKSSVKIDFSTEKSDIYTALKTLKREEKAVILLCYMEDKTHKEIARITNLPLGTVKTHILKGKEKLNQFLSAQGYGK
ncbi:MAG: sigma-70 family RNA polymerase sigma factor [Porphyromonadaceae bacterium]|jgi:RNA polymerase sigma-70 factor (ECF subfamily)|nr:sigma-70 family RNA polymerase sigma factor [Porphyromonadaceae bacterium]